MDIRKEITPMGMAKINCFVQEVVDLAYKREMTRVEMALVFLSLQAGEMISHELIKKEKPWLSKDIDKFLNAYREIEIKQAQAASEKEMERVSESKIIKKCYECGSGDIVRTINSDEPDGFHCHTCKQEYFESVNYGNEPAPADKEQGE